MSVNYIMKRNKDLKAKRAEHVKKQIDSKESGKKIDEVVNDLAETLFLSPRTIWRDYSS